MDNQNTYTNTGSNDAIELPGSSGSAAPAVIHDQNAVPAPLPASDPYQLGYEAGYIAGYEAGRNSCARGETTVPATAPTAVPPAFEQSDRVPGRGMAIASLVLGIVSVAVPYGSTMSTICLICAAVGVFLAVFAGKKGYSGGMRTAGLTLSIIGLVLSSMIALSCLACHACSNMLYESFDVESLQNYMQSEQFQDQMDGINEFMQSNEYEEYINEFMENGGFESLPGFVPGNIGN